MNLALKTRILASGKSQISLARKIGISEPQLSKIVGGWVEPSEKLKEKIARALGCGLEEVFPTWTQGMKDDVEADHDRA